MFSDCIHSQVMPATFPLIMSLEVHHTSPNKIIMIEFFACATTFCIRIKGPLMVIRGQVNS